MGRFRRRERKEWYVVERDKPQHGMVQTGTVQHKQGPFMFPEAQELRRRRIIDGVEADHITIEK